MLPQSIRLATLDDLPCLIELESYWRSDVLAASEDTLRRRLTAHANGQFVAVATNGSLLGAIYTQRVASYATLLTAQRETELELHVPAGSVIQLLGIVQRADARVGDQLRSYVLLHARRDATVERVCGVTRCRAYKPSSGVDYQAHVKEASDPSLLFHATQVEWVSLNASPAWSVVETSVMNCVGLQLETFLADFLGDHIAPHSPPLAIIANILNTERWRAAIHKEYDCQKAHALAASIICNPHVSISYALAGAVHTKDVGDLSREKLAALVSFTGMGGLALEEYAWCLRRQLSKPRSAAVQLVHSSNIDELLHDLADAGQPRSGELAAAYATCWQIDCPPGTTTSIGYASSMLLQQLQGARYIGCHGINRGPFASSMATSNGVVVLLTASDCAVLEEQWQRSWPRVLFAIVYEAQTWTAGAWLTIRSLQQGSRSAVAPVRMHGPRSSHEGLLLRPHIHVRSSPRFQNCSWIASHTLQGHPSYVPQEVVRVRA